VAGESQPTKEATYNMVTMILVLWVATLGADRIDFLGGHTFFVATPFIVLSPLILLGHALSPSREHEPRSSTPISIPTNFLTLILFFLVVVLASILFGLDVERGAVAYTLLFYEITCTVLIAAILLTRSDASDILLRGARIGVLLCLLFSFLELYSWFSGNIVEDSEPTRSFFLLAAHSLGSFVPRLSGVTRDPNRTGLLLLFYWFLLTKLKKTRIDSAFGGLAVLQIFGTLSRTAIISWLCVKVWMLIRRREGKRIALKRKTIAIAASLVLAFGALAYSYWDILSTSQVFADVLSDRFTFGSDTSGGIHLDLARRGLEVWSSTPKNIALGIGYGSSYKVLYDIFPTKYANFHNLYLSILTESGIIALAALLILMAWPIRWNTAWVPLLVGMIISNAFYQTTSEPYFWFLIALVWMSRSRDHLIVSPICSSRLRF
jgi:hypothetical protein